MMRCTPLLIVAALAGCGPQSVPDSVKADAPFSLNISAGSNVLAANEEDASDETAVTRLPGSEYALTKPLTELARIKYDGLPLDRRPDGFTGGEAVHGRYENGMFDFFTMPDGGLWKVRVTSGIADRCGSALTTAKEVADVIKLVVPSVDPAAIAPKLADAIRDNRNEQVLVGSLRFSGSGDCRHTITVTEMDALPPDKRA